MTNIATTQPKTEVALKPIDTVRAVFEKMKPQFAMALPKHITPERMVRVALTAIQNTPKLLECDKQSLYSAVMRAAQLGLEPDGVLGQAYLIPYGKTVQFIPGYKGLIDLARRSGEVSNIIAKEVYSNDEFSVDFSQEIPFVHKPTLEGERGEVTHFWAMARFKDGGFHWDYMTKAEVEAIRDKGNGKGNAVWRDHFIEMGKKTAIRRIAKYLPMSVQKAAMVEDLVESGKKFTTTEYGDIIIDHEAAAAEEPVVTQTAKLDNFAGHDPVTGEVIAENQQAANSPMPTFDINAHNLSTQTGTKEAVKALVAVLNSTPEADRASSFLNHGGMTIVGVLSRHGLGREKGRFTDLGINLPSEQEAA